MTKIRPLFIKKIKLFLVPAITLFFVFILTGRFLVPKTYQAKELATKNKQDEEFLSALEAKVKKLNQLKANNLISDFQKTENILPSDKNIPLIFSVIKQLELTTGVEVRDFGLQPGILTKEEEKEKNPDKTVQSLSFALTVLGSKDNLFQFMDKILKTGPLFNIGNISLDGSAGAYKLTLAISTYYQNLPTNLGKIESPLPDLNASQKRAALLIQDFQLASLNFDQFLQSSASAEPTDKTIFDL